MLTWRGQSTGKEERIRGLAKSDWRFLGAQDRYVVDKPLWTAAQSEPVGLKDVE